MSKKMYTRYFPRNNSAESGVALIIALAMLALLLVMLIGFLASSLLEQRIAFNQSSAVGSRLVARSALARAKTQLAVYSDDLAWFRLRPDSDKMLAPLVSQKDDLNKSAETDAFKALEPLLDAFGITKANWFSANADYPQWNYLDVADTESNQRRLTGRMAYVILPNLGIDPTRLGGSSANGANGLDLDTLPATGLPMLTATNKLNTKYHWLSLDMLTGKKGILDDVSTSGFTGEFTAAPAKEELVNFYMTTNAQRHYDRRWTEASFTKDSNLRYLFNYFEGESGVTAPSHATIKALLSNVNFKPDAVRDQVAANIVDYLDADDAPTSNVDPAQWNTTQPTYTGNERTPYINQIVPAVQLELNGTILSINIPLTQNRLVTKSLSITKQARIYVELVNMYNEALSARQLIIRGLEVKLAIKTTLEGAATKTQNITLSQDSLTIQINPNSIPANSYGKFNALLVDLGDMLLPTVITDIKTIGRTAPIPNTDVAVEVTGVKFDSAVLADANGNIDYTVGQKMDNMPRQVLGSVIYTDPETNTESIDTSNAWVFGDTNASKTLSVYGSFEVNDPRFNLAASEWKSSLTSKSAALAESDVPNLGEKNSDIDMANDDPTKELDMTGIEDPKDTPSAYIRNGLMKSPGELGLIHRGKAWQTINLKSTRDPLADDKWNEVDYLNDGSLLDKLRFSQEENNKTHKYNINYPANHASAFGPLTANLKIATPAQIVSDSAPAALSAAAAKELRNWIANKCYKVGAGNPASASSEVYSRYIHRGLLCNVLTDYAINGNTSPFTDSSGKVCDTAIENMIGKIVPLTRCGDSFEHFTVFAVGQSIKDVKGTIYKYNDDGTINTGNKTECDLGLKSGEKEAEDKITGTTYLVARLRRELSECANTRNCQQGIHDPTCKFTIKVIESYTLNDL